MVEAAAFPNCLSVKAPKSNELSVLMEEVRKNREESSSLCLSQWRWGGKGNVFENEAIDSFAPERPAELGLHCLWNFLL